MGLSGATGDGEKNGDGPPEVFCCGSSPWGCDRSDSETLAHQHSALLIVRKGPGSPPHIKGIGNWNVAWMALGAGSSKGTYHLQDEHNVGAARHHQLHASALPGRADSAGAEVLAGQLLRANAFGQTLFSETWPSRG